MEILADYHMHSTYSPDGDDPPEALCRQALALGLVEIAITEHAEWHPASSQNGFPRVEAYFEAIERCREEFEPLGLTVKAGVELGNPHEFFDEANELIASYPFDVILASLHWLDGYNIHLEQAFANSNPQEVYAGYFVELGRLAMGFDFDIVAHLDRIIWRGTLLGFPFNPYRLEPLIRDTLAIIARYGRTLELNTRFLTHTPNWNESLITIFDWFLQEGGTSVMVNSDAHRVSEVGRNRDIAQSILISAGFEAPESYLVFG
jgi:histidinol-phosphatase (PHP family)